MKRRNQTIVVSAVLAVLSLAIGSTQTVEARGANTQVPQHPVVDYTGDEFDGRLSLGHDITGAGLDVNFYFAATTSLNYPGKYVHAIVEYAPTKSKTTSFTKYSPLPDGKELHFAFVSGSTLIKTPADFTAETFTSVEAIYGPGGYTLHLPSVPVGKYVVYAYTGEVVDGVPTMYTTKAGTQVSGNAFQMSF